MTASRKSLHYSCHCCSKHLIH